MTHATRLLAFCFCGLVLAPSAMAETWTDVTGKFQIEAEYVGVEGTSVILRKADGKTLRVPIAKLSPESRALGRKLYEMQRSGGAAPTPEPPAISPPATAPAAISTDVAATAPAMGADLGFDPPQAPDIPPMASFPENASLEETVKFVLDQALAGHPEVLWHALPAEMRDFADGDEFRSNFTPFIEEQAPVTKQVQDVVSKALKVLVTKKEFVLNSPMMAEAPPEALPIIQQAYDPVVGVIYEVASFGFSTDTLATRTVTEMVDHHGPRIGAHLQALKPLAPPGAIDQVVASIQVEQADDSSGTITVPDPQSGETEVTEMVRYGGRWIPKDLAEEWEANKDNLANDLAGLINEAKEENQENAQQAQMAVGLVAGMAGRVLDQMLAANSQEQFDGALMQVMGMMMGGGGPGGPGGDFGPPGGDFGAPDNFGAPPDDFGAPPDDFGAPPDDFGAPDSAPPGDLGEAVPDEL